MWCNSHWQERFSSGNPDSNLGGEKMRFIRRALAAAAFAAVACSALAQEQYIPAIDYRVGPYAAGGSGFFGGAIDYMTLVNLKGGINGVKLVWEECESEYNATRGVECYERLKKNKGGASLVEPHGLARLWQIGKEKLRLWPFPH
jgi:hypothetical protein